MIMNAKGLRNLHHYFVTTILKPYALYGLTTMNIEMD